MIAQARASAAKTYFVYPPADDPQQPTAYTAIKALEAMGGAHEGEAMDRARELRHEFAATLVRLGDTYWDRDGGKPFAVDYYAQALVFDRSNERAGERAAMTPEKLEALEAKAATQDFSAEEIDHAESLVVLAAPDDDEKAQRLKAYKRRRVKHSGADAPEASLDKLLGAQPEAAPAPVAVTPPPAAAPAAEAANAADLSKAARAMLKQGKTKDAEDMFRRALVYNAGDATALAGMFELQFNRGKYAEAVSFAERLVAVSPGEGRSHLRLGDARFKLGELEAARQAYQRAEQLGASGAGSRLKKVEAKLPKPPPEEAADAEDEAGGEEAAEPADAVEPADASPAETPDDEQPAEEGGAAAPSDDGAP